MQPADPAQQPASAPPLDAVRGLVTSATQRLLGHTIAISDQDWRAPSRLPGWSRGHVATHIARHADALVRLTEWARTGRRQDMYPSRGQREHEIEEGAGRPGLALQVDLDSTAGHLETAFEGLDRSGAWDAEVELRGGLRVPARVLPLARLTEVVLHHVDLDVGFEVSDIDPTTAEWLLEWCAFRLRGRDEFPTLRLTTDTGFETSVGSAGQPLAVSGSSAALLGWLTGRAAPDAVRGAAGLRLPSF